MAKLLKTPFLLRDLFLLMAEIASAAQPSNPGVTRSNILGAVAFGMAVVSGGLVIASLHLLRELAEYAQRFPQGQFSGGPAFSSGLFPLLFMLSSMAISSCSLILLVASYCRARLYQRKTITFMHVGAGVSLLPFFFLVLLYLRRIFLS